MQSELLNLPMFGSKETNNIELVNIQIPGLATNGFTWIDNVIAENRLELFNAKTGEEVVLQIQQVGDALFARNDIGACVSIIKGKAMMDITHMLFHVATWRETEFIVPPYYMERLKIMLGKANVLGRPFTKEEESTVAFLELKEFDAASIPELGLQVWIERRGEEIIALGLCDDEHQFYNE